ncbi:MAG: hypothetical protein QOK58_03750 [Nitrososphaeraceae archaeon]|nr:hypothetical protein [Nitrososphaeraceae archaeon]
MKELGEVQQKGYYTSRKGITRKKKTGLLKDKDGVRVRYDDNTGKLAAIK